jgi:uncharacterized metal-binding protein YceD (DUF177 family)
MGKSQYIIQFGGLSVGVHQFEFDVNETFFKSIIDSEISKANLNVVAILTKQNNLLQMQFSIKGTVEIDCDRCLKEFDLPIEANENLVIKHGNPNDSTDDILVIPEGQEEFNVSHYIYEYVILAIPARRVPCELNKKLYICDTETLSRLNEVSTDNEENNEQKINPMWEKLNKIKYNKN